MSSFKGSAPPDFAQKLIQSKPLVPKKHPITNDYTILTKTLGVGVNGKVLECIHKATGDRRALKVGVCVCLYCVSVCVCGCIVCVWVGVYVRVKAGLQ